MNTSTEHALLSSINASVNFRFGIVLPDAEASPSCLGNQILARRRRVLVKHRPSLSSTPEEWRQTVSIPASRWWARQAREDMKMAETRGASSNLRPSPKGSGARRPGTSAAHAERPQAREPKVAVEAVTCEPVSGAQLPVIREDSRKLRHLSRAKPRKLGDFEVFSLISEQGTESFKQGIRPS